ncbi:hypothetical protein BDM02DRAFT_2013711 [Thelephora ganbajun]|uniref:Uncharacterized protein n=1 Tax=Thelephora ganbajun TaxID=370292 RepID=A0ACB6ZH77_THEGA|nr:hypothetical protein BDM02DRAFT_2013711 [Thelephora ganbajun]
MSTNTSPLDADQEVILQAALENSFSSISSIPTASSEEAETTAESVSTTSGTSIATPATTSEPQPVSDASREPIPNDAHDEWKAEYESNLAKWKHENAVQREKAEKVRGEWEVKRSSIGPTTFDGITIGQSEPELGEHLAKIQRGATGELAAGWEEVSETDSPAVISVNITPEITNQDLSPSNSSLTTLPTMHNPERQAQAATTSGHQRSPSNSSNSKWDSSIPSSLTSSYPSLSLPDAHSQQDSRQASSTTRHQHARNTRDNEAPNRAHDHQGNEQLPRPPASTAIFDSSLSTKTRVIALLGSLTINLFLPFVNGVMMGFGEIFAENVLWKWFGWTKSRNSRIDRGTGSVGNVGLRRR